MNKLFWGFFFLFLDFNLTFGGPGGLNLLPDWLGFGFLVTGCSQLESESDLFKKPQPVSIAMAVVTFILWLMDLLGLPLGNLFPVGLLWSLVQICLRLYVTVLVINAIANIEVRRNVDLDSASLCRVCKVIAVCTVAAVLLSSISVLSLFCAIASAVAGIVFLFAVHKTRRAYQQMLSDHAQGF